MYGFAHGRLLLPFLIACAAVADGATAQTIFKCAADGRVVYSEFPCTGREATVTTIRPSAGPTEADRIAAENQALRRKRSAKSS
jgi:hypothetical protein